MTESETKREPWSVALGISKNSVISDDDKIKQLVEIILLMYAEKEEIIIKNGYLFEALFSERGEEVFLKRDKSLHANLLQLVLKLIKFPSAKICKHSVALDVLSMMEEKFGYDLKKHENMVKAICDCDDELSINMLQQIIEDEYVDH